MWAVAFSKTPAPSQSIWRNFRLLAGDGFSGLHPFRIRLCCPVVVDRISPIVVRMFMLQGPVVAGFWECGLLRFMVPGCFIRKQFITSGYKCVG